MNNFKIGLWGWWQGNNLGDNWIKNIMLKQFPYAEPVPTNILELNEYDFIICGGGGLFIYDAIAPWNNLNDIKVPYGMIGLGAEFEHETRLAYDVSNKAEFFFVRDEYSQNAMHLSPETRRYDCTFISPLKWKEKVDVSKLFYVWRSGGKLLQNSKFNNYICESPNAKFDWDDLVNEYFDIIIEDDFQTKECDIEERIGECGFVISGRYHGIVAAIQMGLPFIAIDICPKIRALAEECGLEEYCIKISEIDKARELISKAIDNIDAIREKEYEYRKKANSAMVDAVSIAKKKIFEKCKPLRGIHYGSYWMGENDIVNTLSDDLAKVCVLKKIDLKQYSKNRDKRVKAVIEAPNTKISVLDTESIIDDCEEYGANFIVLNSAGLVLEDNCFERLREKNIKVIGIELSDPDVYPYNGAVFAHKFDYFYTNSKYSFEYQYNKDKVNIHLMPFAASVDHHYFMPEVERKYDVVIVGHARPDRLAIVRELEKHFSVGTYGYGWDNSLGKVNGLEHIRAINSGKIYLSFSKTMAGFDNVKVGLFEAAACNQVILTSYMEELGDYFTIGKEILCYKDESEIVGILTEYLNDYEKLETMRRKCFSRFLSEHTYESRMINMVEDILMGGPDEL